MCYSAAAAGVPDLARPFAPLILRAELRARARPIQNRQHPVVCSPASHRPLGKTVPGAGRTEGLPRGRGGSAAASARPRAITGAGQLLSASRHDLGLPS